jgi:hypothetical protein
VSWLSPGRGCCAAIGAEGPRARPAAVGGDRRPCRRRWRDRQAGRIDPERLCAAVREPLKGSSEIPVRGRSTALKLARKGSRSTKPRPLADAEVRVWRRLDRSRGALADSPWSTLGSPEERSIARAQRRLWLGPEASGLSGASGLGLGGGGSAVPLGWDSQVGAQRCLWLGLGGGLSGASAWDSEVGRFGGSPTRAGGGAGLVRAAGRKKGDGCHSVAAGGNAAIARSRTEGTGGAVSCLAAAEIRSSEVRSPVPAAQLPDSKASRRRRAACVLTGGDCASRYRDGAVARGNCTSARAPDPDAAPAAWVAIR